MDNVADMAQLVAFTQVSTMQMQVQVQVQKILGTAASRERLGQRQRRLRLVCGHTVVRVSRRAPTTAPCHVCAGVPQ